MTLGNSEALKKLHLLRALLTRAERALAPLADRVYNDNGDCTVRGMHEVTYEHFCDAYFASRALADRGAALEVIEQALRNET